MKLQLAKVGHFDSSFNTYFDEVERLWPVLLSQGDRTQHSVDVHQSPHCWAQKSRSGTDAGSQDVEQVPNTTVVELKDNVHSSGQLLKKIHLDQKELDLEISFFNYTGWGNQVRNIGLDHLNQIHSCLDNQIWNSSRLNGTTWSQDGVFHVEIKHKNIMNIHFYLSTHLSHDE